MTGISCIGGGVVVIRRVLFTGVVAGTTVLPGQ
jgi:hypothetical protein